MKKIINYFVILCGMTGLYFSCIGFQRFPDEKLLLLIASGGCIAAILLASLDTFLYGKKIDNKIFRTIVAIFGGIILILAGGYILFVMNPSLIMKTITFFGIIFFSIAIIKSVLNLLGK